MRKRSSWIAVLPVLTALSGNAFSNDKLWSVNITGGGGFSSTDVSFYESSKKVHQAMRSFGVSDKRLLDYFGTENRRCYMRQSAKLKEYIAKNVSEFQKNPKDCKTAGKIMQIELGDFDPLSGDMEMVCNQGPADVVADIDDLDGVKGQKSYQGSASLKNIDQSLKDVLAEAKARGVTNGHHLELTLIDHGGKMGDVFSVGLGEGGQEVTPKILSGYLRDLKNAGVTVHLHVDACNSGGFNSLSDVETADKTENAASVCTTTITDPDTMASGANDPIEYIFSYSYYDNLKERGTALRAFACSLARDSWNRPQSSIDVVVAEWEASQKKLFEKNPCLPDLSFDGLVAQIDKIKVAISPADTLRKRLIEAYQNEFAAIMNECEKDREGEVRFATNLQACVDRPEAEIPTDVQQLVIDTLSAPRSRTYDVSEVQRHMRFLSLADVASLNKFKNAFCCLSYDLKSGKNLPLCQ